MAHDASQLSHAALFVRFAGGDLGRWEALIGSLLQHKDPSRGAGRVVGVSAASRGQIRLRVIHHDGSPAENARDYNVTAANFGAFFPHLTPSPVLDPFLADTLAALQREDDRVAAAVERQREERQRRTAERRQLAARMAQEEDERLRAEAHAAAERQREAEERRQRAEDERRRRLYSPQLGRMMREAICWFCHEPLVEYSPDTTPHGNARCPACGWLACTCGACRSPLEDAGGCDAQIERLGPQRYAATVQQRTAERR